MESRRIGGFFISAHSRYAHPFRKGHETDGARAKTAREWGPGGKKVNKQEAIATIMKCAEELGRAPSQTELTRLTQVSRRQIRRYFGSYTGALRECGLQRHGGGYKVELKDLFVD